MCRECSGGRVPNWEWERLAKGGDIPIWNILVMGGLGCASAY